jgi:hypothetical protein
MRPIYVIAALALFIFGVMEMFRDYYSSLGFILIIAGLAMLVVQVTKLRVDKMEESDEWLADQFNVIDTPKAGKANGKETDIIDLGTASSDA